MPIDPRWLKSLVCIVLMVCGMSLLPACSSRPQAKATFKSESVQAQITGVEQPQISSIVIQPTPPTPAGSYNADRLTGIYQDHPAAKQFIDNMVAEGFERGYLNGLLSTAQRQVQSIKLLDRYAPSSVEHPPAYIPQPGRGSWSRYRAKFITDTNIDRGLRFWLDNQVILEAVEHHYGVPAEIIVGILGVETRWGRITGNNNVFDVLTTLAFDYPRRSAYFTNELKEFLLMTREEGVDPRWLKGSFAGAMGLAQFMPSSIRKYAVDYDGDGRRDLFQVADAIASVANYLRDYGWRVGAPVVVRANYLSNHYRNVKWGFDSRYSLEELRQLGISPPGLLQEQKVSLLRFANYENEEVWLGQHNFYVITRYNHSSKYAMATYQLGQAVHQAVRSIRGA